MSKEKLIQRAELISILKKYTNAIKIDNKELSKDIYEISNFQDKETILKTLLQEITTTQNEIYSNICSIIILETIEDDVFEGLAISFLKDKKTPDNKKFTIISLMKQKGLDFDYRNITQYIENPEALAHDGVKDFLKNALNDPEVQIDLLDFFVNIPDEEKIGFILNLKDEFKGDDLINAFSILAQITTNKEEQDIILNTLLESSSPFAIEGLEYFSKQKFETKTRAKIKRTIKKIKENNPNFKNDILTKDSEIYKNYIGFIDGRGNFSLVFSRKLKNGLINTLLATANINNGIISCMGFCLIDVENFTSIAKRLFSDSPPVKINPIALKTIYNHYIEKSIKNNIELPYELIVWKNIFNDTRTINYDISEFINSKLNIIKLTKEKVKKFASSKMLETWYYSHGTNEHVDSLIDIIEKEHIVDLDEINILVSKLIDEKFLNDKNFKKEMQSKLLLQSYIAHLAKLKMTSACAYSLCFKNPYIKLLVESSIDKSLYYYFSTKSYELDEDNIFTKNIKTNFKKEELEMLMAQLEEKWS